jgi:hypothetical protein
MRSGVPGGGRRARLELWAAARWCTAVRIASTIADSAGEAEVAVFATLPLGTESLFVRITIAALLLRTPDLGHLLIPAARPEALGF